jgi:hypothetical protein
MFRRTILPCAFLIVLASCAPATGTTQPTQSLPPSPGAAPSSFPTPPNNPFASLTSEQESCLRQAWGDEAFQAIVSFQRPPAVEEQPATAECGLALLPMTGRPGRQPLGTPGVPGQPSGQPSQAGIQVTAVDSSYATASGGLSGWFTSGQAADIMLSGIDFNDSGGALLFNHPGTVTSDGEHLFLADRNNNRVLIWLTLPSTNTPPDLVLGQPDFTANNPGAGAD